MAETRGFCPACGDPVAVDPDERELGDRRDAALCDACYLERFDLVDAPDELRLRICATCGAVHRDGEWTDVDGRDYADVAVAAVTDALGVHVAAEDVQWAVDVEQVDETTLRLHAEFTGSVRDTPVSETVTVPVTLARETCQRCGRIAGDYYAGTVQVRAVDRSPDETERRRAREIATEIVEDHAADGDREAFVTEVTERSSGVDLKVSTAAVGRQVARRLVTEFGGEVSESETLVTEDEDGEGVYRVTFAVRLPPFRPGTVVDPEDGDGPVLVQSVQGNLKGVRLATGDAYEAPFEAGDAPDARRLGTVADAVETTLVAVEDARAVQVLDPETYEATTVPRPDYLDPEADTVRVLRSRAGLHVVPDA